MISKETRTFAILSVITLISWIAIELYKIQGQSFIPENYQKNIAPLNEDLDREFMQSLEDRLTF